MLVLSRKPGEAIVIDLRPMGGDLITVEISKVNGERVKVGLTAAKAIPIHRLEVFVENEETA